MQRLERLGPNRSSWNRTDYPADDSHVDVEAMALSSAADSVANLRLNYDGLEEVPFQFGEDKFTVTVDAKDSPTWQNLVDLAVAHPTVQSFFQHPVSQLPRNSFSLILPSSFTGQEDVLIASDKPKSKEQADLRFSDPLILFYHPSKPVLVCTFDGLKITVPFLGHWLEVEDSKADDKIVGVRPKAEYEANSKGTRGRPKRGNFMLGYNNALLKKENATIFAKLLMRLSKFLKDELQIPSDEYAIAVPFGSWVSAKSTVHARVQLADPGVYWTLMANFETFLVRSENPNDAINAKRLQLLSFQRNQWNRLRFIDYRHWGLEDSTEISREFDYVVRGPTSDVELPEGFLWDDQGRMQLHFRMPCGLGMMQGAMGSVPSELKRVVASFQDLSNGLRMRTFYLIVHNQSCSFALKPLKYMQILHAANGNAQTWASRFLESVQSPERLYSGLLAEGAGLVKCDAALLKEAMYGNEKSKPALDEAIIESLVERNKTNRRLFLERETDATPGSEAAPAPVNPREQHPRAGAGAPTGAASGPKSGILGREGTTAPPPKTAAQPAKPTMANIVGRGPANSVQRETNRWGFRVSSKSSRSSGFGNAPATNSKQPVPYHQKSRRTKVPLPFKEPSAPPPQQTMSLSSSIEAVEAAGDVPDAEPAAETTAPAAAQADTPNEDSQEPAEADGRAASGAAETGFLKSSNFPELQWRHSTEKVHQRQGSGSGSGPQQPQNWRGGGGNDPQQQQQQPRGQSSRGNPRYTGGQNKNWRQQPQAVPDPNRSSQGPTNWRDATPSEPAGKTTTTPGNRREGKQGQPGSWRDKRPGAGATTGEYGRSDAFPGGRSGKSNTEVRRSSSRDQSAFGAGGFPPQQQQQQHPGSQNRGGNRRPTNPPNPARPASQPTTTKSSILSDTPTVSAFGGGGKTKKNARLAHLEREDRDFGYMVPKNVRHTLDAHLGSTVLQKKHSGSDRGHLGGGQKRSGGDSKATFPGPGYTCRICGQPGGSKESHWFQQCPNVDGQGAGKAPGAMGGASSGKRPPGVGYVCKVCGTKGGLPNSHWVEQCSEADVNKGGAGVGGQASFDSGDQNEYWKDMLK